LLKPKSPAKKPLLPNKYEKAFLGEQPVTLHLLSRQNQTGFPCLLQNTQAIIQKFSFFTFSSFCGQQGQSKLVKLQAACLLFS